jgi:hypothetical protein
MGEEVEVGAGDGVTVRHTAGASEDQAGKCCRSVMWGTEQGTCNCKILLTVFEEDALL